MLLGRGRGKKWEVGMAFSVNGVGTTFYGLALIEPDGSYIVTEWVVFFFIPLIPLGSKRIWPVQKEKLPWWKLDKDNIGLGGNIIQ